MSLVNEIRKIPSVTRFFCGAYLVVSVPVMLESLSPDKIVFVKELVIQQFQVWRIFTSFFLGGKRYSLHLAYYGGLADNTVYEKVLDLVISSTSQNSNQLESQYYVGRVADYVWQTFLSGIGIIALNIPLQSFVHTRPFLLALTYLTSRLAPPGSQTSFFGLFNFPVLYLPFALIAFDLMMGGRAAAARSISGAIIGHLWWWGVWDSGILRRLGTAPIWLRNLIGGGRDSGAGGGVHVVPPRAESFMFTVGKLDAGMAILLGERAHLIEFPSLLLPPGATTGSIVNISVQRNVLEEKKRESEFWSLQQDILEKYGTRSPEPPKLELRNVTQTSVTLEWPQINLASAKLRSLDIYRNRQRLASIPSPLTNTSTKLSGLQVDTEYTFQLVLRTTAGVFPSNLLRLRTHTMTDTSGIVVCFGNVQDPVLLDNAKMALREMGAKWYDKIQIDTTHFVCTTPAATPSGAQASGGLTTAPGVEYQKALQLTIPIVQPHWILACHSTKKMVPIHPYYLGANPPASVSLNSRPQSMSQASLSRDARSGSPGQQQKHVQNRQSMPPQRVSSTSPPTPASASSPAQPRSAPGPTRRFEPTPEEEPEEEDREEQQRFSNHVRKGTMSKNFRFPPPAPSTPPVPPVASQSDDAASVPVGLITPSSVEVPPPPPVDKEFAPHLMPESVDDDVGETEEISLN
ncbi:uncharacterized protein FIBRA_03252 [Fibroporia radiculosa]|uniref:Fibronectin type-III domain-containing protein n=1 Tax=Fibroporia radiculosa TaxID=599839 RepID=J4H2A9_9APHY|nr:uncharacterized protein FIBRA_03252 [Fibroporia radiculosa]CCM01204.1 predicted protein [Fibroporia radiculosa]